MRKLVTCIIRASLTPPKRGNYWLLSRLSRAVPRGLFVGVCVICIICGLISSWFIDEFVSGIIGVVFISITLIGVVIWILWMMGEFGKKSQKQ